MLFRSGKSRFWSKPREGKGKFTATPRLAPVARGVAACEPLCGLAGAKAGEDSTPGAFERFRTDFRCAEIGAAGYGFVKG